MPRLRAMSPVRTEFGVHFVPAGGTGGFDEVEDEVDAVADTGVALIALVVCKSRALAAALGRMLSVQTRSMSAERF
jgi:hypothetical protein